jgi:hypothetical protein
MSRVSLLELYTSEGCNSCPPADQWLGQLERDDRLWEELVPLAFHVDYWDYIGWRDRFASPAYSKRQRQYARNGNVRTVYTPGFVLNGAEYRRWFRRKDLDLGRGEDVGRLRIDIDGRQAEVSFIPDAPLPSMLELNIVVTGFDLTTEVKAGENHGQRLEHDFVVLGYERVKLYRNGSGYHAQTRLPAATIEAPRTAVAAWVTLQDDPQPIQAVGGWLNPEI